MITELTRVFSVGIHFSAVHSSNDYSIPSPLPSPGTDDPAFTTPNTEAPRWAPCRLPHPPTFYHRPTLSCLLPVTMAALPTALRSHHLTQYIPVPLPRQRHGSTHSSLPLLHHAFCLWPHSHGACVHFCKFFYLTRTTKVLSDHSLL